MCQQRMVTASRTHRQDILLHLLRHRDRSHYLYIQTMIFRSTKIINLFFCLIIISSYMYALYTLFQYISFYIR